MARKGTRSMTEAERGRFFNNLASALSKQHPCRECGRWMDPFDNFCYFCGTKNTNFQADVFMKEWDGKTLEEVVAKECTPKNHRLGWQDDQANKEPDDVDWKFCNLCGTDRANLPN